MRRSIAGSASVVHTGELQIAHTLEQVLELQRADATVLRRTGHEQQALFIEGLCTEVERAAEPYLRWVSEPNAILRSGRTKTWLRARFPEWEAAGDARQEGSDRKYRMIVVPERQRVREAREAGRRAGKEAA
jgi:hypothetical protein